ncbi:hypothetical protein D9758_008061 [Tetrapyrgos nigripes]|uniref:Vacuolar protein sorting-associated protein 9a n=1 Tax=Tetrapyrgos nigripes TaxID=182062 RepID=A0A8H5FWI4_9AGAR|nr:hypothetical protein D9758_008061 [Tetrapyrgos nigripes]
MSSDEPPFDFQHFLDQIKLRSAEPVAKYLKSFLSNFSKRTFTLNDQIKIINDFLAFIAKQMRESVSAVLPRRPLTTDDLERDRVLAQRISLFSSWIEEKHLDIPVAEGSKGFLMFTQQELLKINHYKAPRDKLICVLNCCKVIYGLIRHLGALKEREKDAKTAEAETEKDEKDEKDEEHKPSLSLTGSADDFLPILIFIVIKSNPPHLISNVEFIQRFRNPSKLQSEAGYYLSSLMGAVAFIETMDYTSLSGISKEDFEAELEKAIQAQEHEEKLQRSSITRTDSSSSSDSTETPTPPDHQPPATSSGSATPLNLPNLPNITNISSSLTRELRGLDLSVGEDARRFIQRTGDAMKTPLNKIGRIFSEALDSFDGQGSPGQGPSGRPSGSNTPSSRPGTPQSSLFPHSQVEETPQGVPGGTYADAPIHTPYKPRVRRGPSSSSSRNNSPTLGQTLTPSTPSYVYSGSSGGAYEETPTRVGGRSQQGGPYTNSPLALGPSQSYPASHPQHQYQHLSVGTGTGGVQPPPRNQSLPIGSGSRGHTSSHSWSGNDGVEGQGAPQVPHGTHPPPPPPQLWNPGLPAGSGGSRPSTPHSADFDFSFSSLFGGGVVVEVNTSGVIKTQIQTQTPTQIFLIPKANSKETEKPERFKKQEAREMQDKVETLRQMFPSVDAEVVGWVLEANEGDLGRCVESLLEMGSGEGGVGAGAGMGAVERVGGDEHGEAVGYDVETGEPDLIDLSGSGADEHKETTTSPTSVPASGSSSTEKEGSIALPKSPVDKPEQGSSASSATVPASLTSSGSTTTEQKRESTQTDTTQASATSAITEGSPSVTIPPESTPATASAATVSTSATSSPTKSKSNEKPDKPSNSNTS